ncbi:PLP-dependent aminotransferase family protein [Pseudomonas sp. 2FE]|uniref:MocR-like pyridoxine biosynthesis transcription factor PdxR n=1 Tax=Pseudomonas sp. 2FE TaxID=2502190 RepID=UPI0010F750D8|nr:PLP-dependent aminotransferase family protein [Pseudomonas sp. 2FE]
MPPNTPCPPLPLDPSGIHLDRRQGLSRQLYQALRERILGGQLSSRVRLPASRDLAAALGVSRNTVVRAYDQLYAEGYLEGRIGDGTYVAELAGSAAPPSAPVPPASAPQTSLLWRLQNNRLPAPRAGAPRAFRVGIPAFDLFPFDIWARLQSSFWRHPPLERLGYAEPAGDPQLRELIAAYLRNSRGLVCDPAQVIVTSGAQQAISLCAQLLLEVGDGVAVENPGYRAAGQAFALAGARLHGIAVDRDGLDCAQLAALKDCRLAYVTPSHQYPTGVTLSLARRLELLEWAEREQAWIVEDDYDGEYRYRGTPLSPLAALDRQGRVLYVGTFSKIAFPGLRLGYLVVPPALADAFAQLRALGVRHSEIGTQAVMAEFIAAGHFQRHIRRMRRAARARRDALLRGWPEPIAGCQPLPAVDAGLHLSVRVASRARERELIARAAAVGVELNGLSDYWLADSPGTEDQRAGLVLGFAGVAEPQIAQALRALRKAWAD